MRWGMRGDTAAAARRALQRAPVTEGKSATDGGAMDGSGMGAEVYEKLSSVLAGDPEATAWLYDAFAPRLLRRLRLRYRYFDCAELEDLLHDVFVLFLRNDGGLLRSFLAQRSPRQLTESSVERRLWDVACGMATNRRRSFGRRKVVPLESFDHPAPNATAEQSAIDRDQLRRLDACLREGNARVYLYFKLRYRDGLAPEEIAQVTGWSRKATYKLKQALNRQVETCVGKLRLEPVP